MKHLCSLLLLLLPLSLLAQSAPPRDATGKIIYSEVVPMGEINQAELYSRALLAIPQNAKEVIRQEPTSVAWQDEQQMLITTDALRLPVKLKYAVVLQEKDGRYMYSITDVFVEDKKAKGFVPLEQAAIYQPIPPQYYFKNGNLRPMGLAIQRVNAAHQEEIDKAIAAVVENITRTMALSTGDNW